MGITFDAKAKIDEIISKLKSDENLRTEFLNDPVRTVEELLDVDLPDAQVQEIVDTIRTKAGRDTIGKVFGSFIKEK